MDWKKNKFGILFLILLILVALAFLSLLDLCCYDPPEVFFETSDLLNAAYQVPSSLETSHIVPFYQGSTVSRRAIVERANIGISEEQICLSLGDYSSFSGHGFESTENKIEYVSDGQKDVRLSALCYEGVELPSLVGTDSIYEDIDDEWLEHCECVTNPELNQKICCAVMLRISR